MKHESKYNNGDEVKDNVTGFIGIVMVVCFYSTGCIHYGMASKKLKENGEVAGWEYFDESRLTMKKKKAVSFAVNKEKPSGPFPNPPQQ